MIEELSYVITYCQDDFLELDVDKIVNDKMESNEKNYPVRDAKGNAKKYREF